MKSKEQIKKDIKELTEQLKECIIKGDKEGSNNTAKKLSILAKELNKKDPQYTPKFKIGDKVVYSLSYAKVIFNVSNIKFTEDNIPYYELKGESIIEQYQDNPYMTEYKRYEPFCEVIDDRMILLSDSEYFQ